MPYRFSPSRNYAREKRRERGGELAMRKAISKKNERNLKIERKKIEKELVKEEQERIQREKEINQSTKTFHEKTSKFPCLNCFERRVEMKLNDSSLCDKCIKNPAPFASSNNLNPSPIPDELKNLTEVEQMLIAPIVILVLVVGHVLPRGQFGYGGQYYCFSSKS